MIAVEIATRNIKINQQQRLNTATAIAIATVTAVQISNKKRGSS